MNEKRAQSGGAALRVVVAAVVALVSVVSYCTMTSENPITEEDQRVGLTPAQEMALGAQAAPQLAAQHGGPSSDATAQARVARIGNALVDAMRKMEGETEEVYEFHFTLLADEQVVNAFALPGGRVFLTKALYDRLETDAEIAAVLGHEVGHVVHRHGAERLAKQQLTAGLAGAATIAAWDPESPGQGRATVAIAQAVGSLVNMKYGRDDELESDAYGVLLLDERGLDPRAMIRLMEVLASAGGEGPPEFFSTHPNPDNRIEKIRERIEDLD